MNFDFFQTTMPSTRKADFYLGCLDGSVFIDFNRTSNNQIYLCRISFDGYGCCNLENGSNPLSQNESKKFINEIKNENLNQAIITKLVKQIIKINREYIWNDALEKYNLISKD